MIDNSYAKLVHEELKNINSEAVYISKPENFDTEYIQQKQFFPTFSLVWRKSKCKQNCKMQVDLDTGAIKSLFYDSLMNDFLHWMKEPWKQTSYLLYK